jgi:hypothetical protein
MRFLFVTYCFGNAKGHALVGVYKRGLRIALELAGRGHEVGFVCPGRENFTDETTAAAARLLKFVDLEFRNPTPEAAILNRREFTSGIRAFRPDVVVIGEAPVAGFLLEATLSAVELEIPIAVVDNAHNPTLAKLFWKLWQTMFDGIVLTGPRSFWHGEAPPHVLQIPPFIQPDAASARDLVTRELGLRGERLVTVLAYDFNVQALALSVLRGLEHPETEAVFLTHEIEACRRQVESLPPELRGRVRILPPQPDGLHFGLLQLSRLVIGKCAFMQVSECLSLHTPILGFAFAGQFSLQMVPAVCRQFSHSTSETAASAETLAAARRLIEVQPEAMRAVHDGTLGAAARAADFLESLPDEPRRNVGDACERALRQHYERTLSPARAAAAAPWGRRRLTDEMIRAALARVHGEAEIAVREVRFGHIRTLERGEENIFAATASYTAGGAPQFRRLWLRLFSSPQGLQRSVRLARSPGSERRLYLVRPEQRFLIEEDRGEALLPTLEAAPFGSSRPAAGRTAP